MIPAAPASPVGDVLQTPQFQLRRLKKQLAIERENRDELEVELAENRKLITEKGQCLGGVTWARGGISRAGTCGFGADGSDPIRTVLRSCWSPERARWGWLCFAPAPPSLFHSLNKLWAT